MKERINWIDWAKALAVMTVVFCHLPQSQEFFYYRYLQAVIIVIFFFLSGYLKRDRGSNRENWRKYWWGLCVPYIIYNVLVYPYWFGKFWLQNGALPDAFTAMKPILGALLFQHENAFCEPLNGPLWYLPAILFMHLLIDLCRKTRYEHWIMIGLCLLSFVLYAANKYWFFAPDLTPMGIMRNLPYYYIGYVMGQKQLFREVNTKRDGLICLVCIASSLLLFHWHLQAFFGGQHLLHIILYYPVNLCFLFGILCGCKLLDGCHSKVIVNLSVGTLVIIGLHPIPVTIVNALLSKMTSFTITEGYQWYEALPIALLITAILYPIILFGKRYAPVLLGRRIRL